MKSPVIIFLRLINKFDLATSFFRSFELFAIKQTLENLKIDTPILDLGCAEGNIGKEIFVNSEIYGLDYEIKYLFAAKKLNKYKALITADATSMPFKDSSFQLVFSNSVLEHIEHRDDVLKEVKRILKVGGLFLFTIPNDKFFSQLFFYKMLRFCRFEKLASSYARERNKRLNHFHLYSQKKMEKDY